MLQSVYTRKKRRFIVISVIEERLETDFKILSEKGYEVVGIFLTGAQNYLLSDESSDIDTKAVIVPHFEDIVRSKQWVTDTIINADNSHTEVKDIRNMFDCYTKQNINFLETLFTKYCYLNPDYTGEWLGAIIKNRELIAHYDECKALKAMFGNMQVKFKNMYKSMPHSADEIEKYGYALKDFHHLMRLGQFIRRYISGEKYENCLIAEDREQLIKYKREGLPLEVVSNMATTEIESTRQLVNDTLVLWKDKKPVKEVEDILHQVEYDFIKQSILHDLGVQNG